jgi:hypothetical protein
LLGLTVQQVGSLLLLPCPLKVCRGRTLRQRVILRQRERAEVCLAPGSVEALN